uniref:C2 domain-containing protein n=1 Tax=Kalanchoe fedtschenkoi TaxID=63787 RepID=A0A7N0T2N5_KALFE
MQLLEINLISAQGLKHPHSCKLRRMHTYAIVWVDPATKVRTRIDKLGARNPTWNDRFFFKVTPHFLTGDTSAVTVEIFAVGYLKDPLIGTVRTYLSNILPPSKPSTSDALLTPSFTAVQIRRPSGRFHGVLNLGAMVVTGSDFAALGKASAIDYHHLMGENPSRACRRTLLQRTESEESHGSSWCGSVEYSEEDEDDDDDDGTGSTTSASSAASATTVLKDLNGVRELAGKGMRLYGGGFLMCGLLTSQKNIHLSPSDENRI